ncbi:unnamed protein product [Allacma fusca]|uniref:Peptidase S1 domain-containing protein n=1 Tax=Allacma fusca TaxID=39272 RepID=A0A8J2P0N0_9HEXA|nr:unnamed protein product [Allacma fusca]
MVRKHPKYDSNSFVNDIALVEIPGSGFNFNDSKIARACLPYKFVNTVLENKQVLASGWGQTINDKPSSTSTQLRNVILNLFEYNQCNGLLQKSRVSNQLNQNQCCTRTPNKDICQGDSGGSIDYLNGRYYAYGVTSYVIGSCANPNGASVMTKVSKYLTWIEEITRTTSYCKS